MSSLSKQSAAVRFSLISLALGLLVGCGGTYDASVSGTATFNSAPLTAGTVKFNPEQAGPSGYGLIQSDGSYSIMTGREEGLPSGSYVVTVVANEPPIPSKNPAHPPTPGKPLTPAWYRDPAQSALKYTVEPGGNEINLELTSTPPAGWKSGAGR
jgi:hypothetical protein